MSTETLLVSLFVVGITAEAVTAALSAGRQKMDWFGVVALAALTSLGGGTIRDILLDAYPLTWVETPAFLVIVIIAALITTQLAFLAKHFERIFLTGDAIGLAAFSVLGTQIALELGHGFVIAAVAAVVTGVSGGIMRDILSDRVPLVFSQDLYASIAILTAGVYMLLLWAGVPENWTIVIALLVAFITRMSNMKNNRGLPVFAYDESRPLDPRGQLSARYLRRGLDAAKRRAGNLRDQARRYSRLNRWPKRRRKADEEQKWPPEEDE